MLLLPGPAFAVKLCVYQLKHIHHVYYSRDFTKSLYLRRIQEQALAKVRNEPPISLGSLVKNEIDNAHLCLELEADPWVTKVVEDQFIEKTKNYPRPGPGPFPDKVDILLGIPNPNIDEKAWAWLELPYNNSGTLITGDGQEVQFNVKLAHPEIVEFKVQLGSLMGTYYRGIGEPLTVFGFPLRPPLSVMRNEKLHKLVRPEINARHRGTYPRFEEEK